MNEVYHLSARDYQLLMPVLELLQKLKVPGCTFISNKHYFGADGFSLEIVNHPEHDDDY